jgi:hypothetical protein
MSDPDYDDYERFLQPVSAVPTIICRTCEERVPWDLELIHKATHRHVGRDVDIHEYMEQKKLYDEMVLGEDEHKSSFGN